MLRLEDVKPALLIEPSQVAVDYSVFVQDHHRKIVLPSGIANPIIIDIDQFTQQTVESAHLSPTMGFLEMFSRTRKASRALTLATMMESARDHHGAKIIRGYPPQFINETLDFYITSRSLNLIKDLIAEYPVSLWGVAATLPPDIVTAINVENMGWTLKAMAENYRHMRRVSRYTTNFVSYLTREYQSNLNAGDVFETLFYENNWSFDPQTISNLIPWILFVLVIALHSYINSLKVSGTSIPSALPNKRTNCGLRWGIANISFTASLGDL